MTDQLQPAERVIVEWSCTFAEPGTQFVKARVVAQRNGVSGDIYTRVQNLARIRVIVGE